MAYVGEGYGRQDLERLLWVVGAVFVLAGIGLGLSALGLPFIAEPFVIWGALGGVATATTLPLVAWTCGRSYRPSMTGQVGTVLLALGGLTAGLAAVPGLARTVGPLDRMGWLLFLVAGCLLLVHLLRASARDGVPAPSDRFAAAYANRANRVWDETARWQVVAGNAYVIVSALVGLQGGWDGSAADGAGLLLWYGWLGSLATAAVLYYVPRLFGARGEDEHALRLGVALWHVGIVLSLILDRRGLLLLTVAGGTILFVVFARVVQSALRRTLRVVGSRRVVLDLFYRQLLFAGIVFSLLASLTVPWWSGMHVGASRILWTWLLFVFIPVAIHVFHPVPIPGVRILPMLGAGVLGSLLGIWAGPEAQAGVGLLAACLLAVGGAMLWRPRRRAALRLLNVDPSGGQSERRT